MFEFLKENQKALTVLAQFLTPLLVGIFGLAINATLKRREVDAEYVKIAAEVLRSPDADPSLRKWAAEVFRKKSPIALPDETDAALGEGTLSLPRLDPDYPAWDVQEAMRLRLREAIFDSPLYGRLGPDDFEIDAVGSTIVLQVDRWEDDDFPGFEVLMPVDWRRFLIDADYVAGLTDALLGKAITEVEAHRAARQSAP